MPKNPRTKPRKHNHKRMIFLHILDWSKLFTKEISTGELIFFPLLFLNICTEKCTHTHINIHQLQTVQREITTNRVKKSQKKNATQCKQIICNLEIMNQLKNVPSVKHPCSLFTEKGFRDRDEKRFRLSARNKATACEMRKKKKNDKRTNGIIGMS